MSVLALELMLMGGISAFCGLLVLAGAMFLFGTYVHRSLAHLLAGAALVGFGWIALASISCRWGVDLGGDCEAPKAGLFHAVGIGLGATGVLGSAILALMFSRRTKENEA